jgi:hypothetical protein
LEVDDEKASYKQKLEVLQQQEELIEDEAEQEQVRDLVVTLQSWSHQSLNLPTERGSC